LILYHLCSNIPKNTKRMIDYQYHLLVKYRLWQSHVQSAAKQEWPAVIEDIILQATFLEKVLGVIGLQEQPEVGS